MSGETIPVLFRKRLPDGSVGSVRFEVPVKTGDEAFDVLERFEKQHGPKEPNPEAEQRWLELKAKIARGAR